MPTFSFASFTCNATRKRTCRKPIPSSFSSAGVRSKPAGTSSSLTNVQFEELCDRFVKTNPTWMTELRKKREHYLAFLKYPEYMRKSFSTTNVVEAINGQLEIMRRNSGGYFHSEDTLKF